MPPRLPRNKASAHRSATRTLSLAGMSAVQAAISTVVGSSQARDVLLLDTTPSLMGLETAFTMYSDSENYDGDVCRHASGSTVGGYAVNYWRIANSWNQDWRESGEPVANPVTRYWWSECDTKKVVV